MSVADPDDQKRPGLVLAGMILLLVIAVLRTNYGLWSADFPLGDDPVYLDRAYRLAQAGEWTANLYLVCYSAIFRFLTSDPFSAHALMRLGASLLSTITLFLLLTRLKRVSLPGAMLMALLWNLNLLNTPLVQYGNINLFIFAIVCLAGFLWLGAERKGRMAALVLLVLVTGTRYEYVLLLTLLLLWSARQWYVGQTPQHRRPQLRLALAGVALLLVAGLTALTLSPPLKTRAVQAAEDLNAYFFLGFTQHYAIWSVTRDPTLHLDPYTEYRLVIERQFPGATDFASALQVNPGEVGRYLAGNTLANLTRLHYILPGHSILLPSGLVTNGLTGRFGSGDFVAKKFAAYPLLWLEQALTVLFIAGGALWLLRRTASRQPLRALLADPGTVFIVSLAAVAGLSVVMHIPDPRYWIVFIPLAYWGGAALLSRGFAALSRREGLILAALLSLAMVNPVFTSTLNLTSHKNRDLALALRASLAERPHPAPLKVLGHYPDPLLAMAVPGRWASVTNLDLPANATFQDLVSAGSCDLVIVDGLLQKTARYAAEGSFFQKMLANPEAFGYERLLEGENRDGVVDIFIREDAPPSPRREGLSASPPGDHI